MVEVRRAQIITLNEGTPFTVQTLEKSNGALVIWYHDAADGGGIGPAEGQSADIL